MGCVIWRLVINTPKNATSALVGDIRVTVADDADGGTEKRSVLHISNDKLLFYISFPNDETVIKSTWILPLSFSI